MIQHKALVVLQFTIWIKEIHGSATPIHCFCKCVCQPPASIVIVVSPSKPGEGVGEAFGPLSASHFLCLCVCLCVCWPKPLSPYTSSWLLCVEACALSLFLALSPFLSLSLITVLLGWSQSYFWRFLLWKDYPPPPSLGLSVSHSHTHKHTAVKLIISNCISERQRTHACHWRHLDSSFKDSGGCTDQ